MDNHDTGDIDGDLHDLPKPRLVRGPTQTTNHETQNTTPDREPQPPPTTNHLSPVKYQLPTRVRKTMKFFFQGFEGEAAEP